MGLRLIRSIGGKGLIWQWVLSHLPYGKVYVEPFGGGASLLLNKPPHPVEVYNDLNGDLVNLFRAVQDEKRFEKLKRRLDWTLYSLDEFRLELKTLDESTDPDERAWATYVTTNQGFGGKHNTEGDWGRGFKRNIAVIWARGIVKLEAIRDRLTNVLIDNRDALEVIKYWDTEETVFYIDPPYPHATRTSAEFYKHEMSDEEHEKLVDLLLKVKGAYAVSTYPNELYDRLLENKSVRKVTRNVACSLAGRIRSGKLQGEGNATKHVPRTEVLYVKENRKAELFQLEQEAESEEEK